MPTERQPITMLTKGYATVIKPSACQRLYENQFIEYILSNFNPFHIFTNYFIEILFRINISSAQSSSTCRYDLKFLYEHLFPRYMFYFIYRSFPVRQTSLYQVKNLLCKFLLYSCSSSPVGSNIILRFFFFEYPQFYFPQATVLNP